MVLISCQYFPKQPAQSKQSPGILFRFKNCCIIPRALLLCCLCINACPIFSFRCVDEATGALDAEKWVILSSFLVFQIVLWTEAIVFIQIRHVITKHKESFFFAVFIGLLTYMYMMTNKLPNWDEVAAMFSKGTTITSGRWGLEYTDRLFPNFSLPWLWGCVSICIVGITACLIIEIFEIHNKALKLILAGLMR